MYGGSVTGYGGLHFQTNNSDKLILFETCNSQLVGEICARLGRRRQAGTESADNHGQAARFGFGWLPEHNTALKTFSIRS